VPGPRARPVRDEMQALDATLYAAEVPDETLFEAEALDETLSWAEALDATLYAAEVPDETLFEAEEQGGTQTWVGSLCVTQESAWSRAGIRASASSQGEPVAYASLDDFLAEPATHGFQGELLLHGFPVCPLHLCLPRPDGQHCLGARQQLLGGVLLPLRDARDWH
jgi:hypothetical protein